VLVASAEAIVRTLCEAADGYLGSGKPDRAKACLKQIPVWEEVLSKPDTRRFVEMLLAKTIRRIGAVEEQERLSKRAAGDSRLAEIALYELALTYWTKACMTQLPEQDVASWQKAIDVLGDPKDWLKLTTGTSRGTLLRLGAYVNIRSTLSCVRGKEAEAPDAKLCGDLREMIDHWKVCQDKEVRTDPRYDLQLLNALRALCRGYLSSGDVRQGEGVLQELKDLMATNPDRESLALTDFLLLTAWAAVESGKRETAAATLECTTYLLRSMRDPLLEWFQDVVRGKWERMTQSATP
jgi:hypothetical protein